MRFIKNGTFGLKIGTDSDFSMGIPNNDFVLYVDTFLMNYFNEFMNN